jgi:hypothetical protein
MILAPTTAPRRPHRIESRWLNPRRSRRLNHVSAAPPSTSRYPLGDPDGLPLAGVGAVRESLVTRERMTVWQSPSPAVS